MTISQLMNRLEQLKGEVGDLEVMVYNSEGYGSGYGWFYASDIEKLSIDQNGYVSNYSVNRTLACNAVGIVD